MVKLNRQIYLCIKTERITKLFPPVLVPFIYLAVNSNKKYVTIHSQINKKRSCNINVSKI